MERCKSSCIIFYFYLIVPFSLCFISLTKIYNMAPSCLYLSKPKTLSHHIRLHLPQPTSISHQIVFILPPTSSNLYVLFHSTITGLHNITTLCRHSPNQSFYFKSLHSHSPSFGFSPILALL